MGKSSFFDSLVEFHLHKPPTSVYVLINHIVQILKNDGSTNLDALWDEFSNSVSEEDAARILQLACKKARVDFNQLISDINAHVKHISLRLLLRMIAFPVSYVAAKLQIDPFRAAQLLDQLRKSLIIGDPLTWLKDMEFYAEKERHVYENEKAAELHGEYVTHAPRDTAQERRERKRRLGELRPHIDPM